jgi:drug/metabolite transporter (DMT)-like permease
MIQRHPGRVLLVLVVLAGAFLALGGPGRNDTSGPWMYISGMAFIAFLLTVACLFVLAAYVVAVRRRDRRSRAERTAGEGR